MHFVKAKGILSSLNGMNVYRGCTHGCIYCDSRSKCYSFTHDFEDIEVKENAPELLEAALLKKRKKCMISTGAMCDPYIPLENKLLVMQRCLKIIDALGFGVDVQTKSTRILRDMELFKSINKKSKAVVEMTLTTADDDLCRIIEPNVSVTSERIAALKEFSRNGIPTVVWMTPILPFIDDTEENVRALLNACFDIGVKGILTFSIGMTLREGDREYYYAALDKSFPGIKEKYIRRYGNAYECISDNNDYLMKIVESECRKRGIMTGVDEIFTYLHAFPEPYEAEQLTLC